ncbi:hypothetical protein I302_108915 [Kwoniella bestiolae CBS 10118]|uniref:Uncharacterized protein n=1 Tax=Kwoniella bestiolae CBS 10118 TaxID=1296100 RepID=A0A1B9FUG4_9TREE|nr:hypothetical protein I302_08055 [Kwoniella bestiolae CBS 10118]OCF22407.1 hypothetical protein I302_08055 [Kwoniella bestiolae CBS 10118]
MNRRFFRSSRYNRNLADDTASIAPLLDHSTRIEDTVNADSRHSGVANIVGNVLLGLPLPAETGFSQTSFQERVSSYLKSLPRVANRYSRTINAYALNEKHEEAKSKGLGPTNLTEALLDRQTRLDISPWIAPLKCTINVDKDTGLTQESEAEISGSMILPRSFALRDMIKDESQIANLIDSNAFARIHSITLRINPKSNDWLINSVKGFGSDADNIGEYQDQMSLAQSHDDYNLFTAMGNQVTDSAIGLSLVDVACANNDTRQMILAAIGPSEVSVNSQANLRIEVTRRWPDNVSRSTTVLLNKFTPSVS